MYKYWGFGLFIDTAIQFPELLPATSACTDVTINMGVIPVIQFTTTFSTGRIIYHMNDNELVFSVPGIATYYVANGNQIIISADNEDIESRVLRMFVLAGAMAAILQQRKQVPLHAAAIVKGEGLVLIGGHSGAGKSTALAGLYERGYTMFSDDITVLHHLPDNDCVRGSASYPMVKLWEQSLQTLQLNDRSFPLMPGMQKYGVFFHRTFDTQHYPVGSIILLESGNNDAVRCRPLKGAEAFSHVMQHVYKPGLFRQPVMRALCFERITTMMQQADVHLVSRPAGCAPETLLNTIISLL
jgi:hypothetical protein